MDQKVLTRKEQDRDKQTKANCPYNSDRSQTFRNEQIKQNTEKQTYRQSASPSSIVRNTYLR